MKKIIIILISVFGLTAIAGCAGDNGGTATVESVAVICGIGSTTNVERYAGVIEAGSDIKVEKDSEKKVEEVLVKAGDTVKKDQVLFRYDKAQTELNIQKTQIEIEQLNNTVTTKQNEIKTLESEISSGKLDEDTKTGYTLQIQELKADITETELSAKSKQAELESLQGTLNNLEVRSPDEGTVQSVNSNEENNEASQEKAFIIIRKTSAFRVKGYVNETNKGSLYEGMEVLIRSRVDDALLKGNIKNIDLKNPVSDTNNDYMATTGDDTSNSSKYPFYVELEKTDGFIIGQHVYIEPDYGQSENAADTVYLPAYYINDSQGTPWVWARDKNERLEKRDISIGEYDTEADTYEVKDGLSPEDYIAAPDDSLKAGMKCVVFDFTSDDYMDLDIENINSTEEMIEPADDGSGENTEVPVEKIDDGPEDTPEGDSGVYTPGMVNPFFGSPDISNGVNTDGEEGSEPESETKEEAQEN